MRHSMSSTLRKAAVLIHSLDVASAEALLKQMGEAQAALVRAAVLEIDEIEEAERQAVMREFMGNGGLSALPSGNLTESPKPDGGSPPADEPSVVEPDERSAEDGLPARDEPLEGFDARGGDAPRFASLRQADAATIAALLQGEHPQTIALVLAHLPPERAAAILRQLAPSIQVPVLQRIAELEPADPEVLSELERQLQRLLSQQVGMARQPSAGLSALHAILDATGGEQRRSLVERLGVADRALVQARGEFSRPRQQPGAEQPGAPPSTHPAGARRAESLRHLEFSDLAEWAAEDLAALMAAEEPAVVLLALAGADESLMRRVLQPLSPREARELRRKIERQGPLRLKDVQLAQQRLTLLARRLVAEGRIAPPHTPRFATAV